MLSKDAEHENGKEKKRNTENSKETWTFGRKKKNLELHALSDPKPCS